MPPPRIAGVSAVGVLLLQRIWGMAAARCPSWTYEDYQELMSARGRRDIDSIRSLALTLSRLLPEGPSDLQLSRATGAVKSQFAAAEASTLQRLRRPQEDALRALAADIVAACGLEWPSDWPNLERADGLPAISSDVMAVYQAVAALIPMPWEELIPKKDLKGMRGMRVPVGVKVFLLRKVTLALAVTAKERAEGRPEGVYKLWYAVASELNIGFQTVYRAVTEAPDITSEYPAIRQLAAEAASQLGLDLPAQW
jgi:hypothetical protein